MYVASSEPPSLRSLGPYSAACEEHGADFLILGPTGLTGIQRKACGDLVASIQGPNGDRLGRELAQLQNVDTAILLIEGSWDWRGDHSGRRGCETMTRQRYRSLILGVQYLENVMVFETTGLEDTRATLEQIESWMQNPGARNLRGRPKPKQFDNVRDRAIFTCQSVPGWSHRTAEATLEHFGKLPIAPTCTLEELCAVDGVGPKRAKAFMQTFGG